MHAALGILTTRGGMTSPRGGGGARHGPALRGRRSAVSIDLERETLQRGGTLLQKGDIITIDGSTGQIIKGRVAMREPDLSEDFNA
jgi:pyruvate,orthophosphate dikinase